MQVAGDVDATRATAGDGVRVRFHPGVDPVLLPSPARGPLGSPSVRAGAAPAAAPDGGPTTVDVACHLHDPELAPPP